MIKKQQQFKTLLTRITNFDLKSYILQDLTFAVEVREVILHLFLTEVW